MLGGQLCGGADGCGTFFYCRRCKSYHRGVGSLSGSPAFTRSRTREQPLPSFSHIAFSSSSSSSSSKCVRGAFNLPLTPGKVPRNMESNTAISTSALLSDLVIHAAVLRTTYGDRSETYETKAKNILLSPSLLRGQMGCRTGNGEKLSNS